jgi:hypothetical protein
VISLRRNRGKIIGNEEAGFLETEPVYTAIRNRPNGDAVGRPAPASTFLAHDRFAPP